MKISSYDGHQNRPCIRCAAPTDSHTDFPLCGVCFRYLTLCYCGPRCLTEGIRDGLAALDRYRAHCGLTGPAPTSEVWAWLLPYLAARGRYARRHQSKIPPATHTEELRLRRIYGSPSMRGRVTLGPDRIPAPG